MLLTWNDVVVLLRLPGRGEAYRLNRKPQSPQNPQTLRPQIPP